MSKSKIEKVLVLGSGILGGQIAFQSAYKGKQVTVYDINKDAIAACKQRHKEYGIIYQQDVNATAEDIKKTFSRITYTTDITTAKNSDFIIEAVPEVPLIKIGIYKKLQEYINEETLIATNSSTLLASDFVNHFKYPRNYCALHFANMIWKANIAEVMSTPETSAETLTRVFSFAIEIGMIPFPVEKENHGYILNGWLVPLTTAAITLVANGVGTPENIDRLFLICNKGAQLGPLGMVDVIGMKTTVNILSYWAEQHNDLQMFKNAKFIQESYVELGKLGLASGEGFYKYPNPAYAQPGFLETPDFSAVPDLVAKTLYKGKAE
ncbi:MAG: 3-hydroxyacyl-CoA dehydrogenase [Alphaproteobacteria bacterium]